MKREFNKSNNKQKYIVHQAKCGGKERMPKIAERKPRISGLTWWHLVSPSIAIWQRLDNMWLFSSDRASLWLISNSVVSTAIILDSIGSPGCSLGVPGTEGPALLVPENESRCIRACLDARRFISRRPTRSPRLKLPPPCLNSQSVESGEPVWKTSFTVD